MKVALSWFSDYLDMTGIDAKTYRDALTMSGTMVEGTEEIGADLKNVVTGKITEIAKHEDSDHLQICQLDIGDGEKLQIVTGAQNVKVGQIVPVALDGSTLPGGVSIKKGKLRGVESNGMLCSHEELGLTVADLGYEPEYGILILDDSLPLGKDIKEVFGIGDSVIEFEITSNRPDCQSVVALARETAVTFDREFKLEKPVCKGDDDDVKNYVKVDVEDKQYCPRYCARMVKNVKIAPSPKWLAKRLEMSGIRSINNIVDITNYILLEYGQPMHAFDMRDVVGNHIIVRRAEEGEMITTLDEQERKLDSSMLVIADEERAVAVAGVMGALNSEVKDDTTTVLFESANFDGASVRITAKKLGLRTEASAKYEKGLDPLNTEDAVNRACELIEMLGCGEVVGGMIDVCGNLPSPRTIDFRPDRINAFLGTNIDSSFMKDTFKKLGFEVNEKDMKVTVPTSRLDVEAEADLAEEVARIYGYNEIESTKMRGATTAGGKNPEQKTDSKVKNILVGQGYYEIITYTFTNPNIYDKLLLPKDSPLRKNVVITNPLGEENSVMRTTTLASMLEILSRNYKQKNSEAKLFENAKVFIPVEGEKLPEEHRVITLGAYGKCDFYDIKGTVEELFDTLGINDIKYAPDTENPSYHSGRCAKILSDGQQIGTIGQVHPLVCANFELSGAVYAAEIDFRAVCKLSSENEKHYVKLAKYPSVSRDIAIVVDEDVLAGDIADAIKSAGGKTLVSVDLFDIYRGEQVESGKKSMAYSITLQGEDKTLTEEEINKVTGKIIKSLEYRFSAVLRDN